MTPNEYQEPLEIGFPDLFSSRERPGFPVFLDQREGISLAASDLSYADGELSFQLLVSYQLRREFLSGFQRISSAINVLVEDSQSGRCAHFNLDDPHKVYPARSGDNWRPEARRALPGTRISHREIPLVIATGLSNGYPHLVVRSVLQQHVSNSIAFETARAGAVCHALRGEAVLQDPDEAAVSDGD